MLSDRRPTRAWLQPGARGENREERPLAADQGLVWAVRWPNNAE